MLDTKFIRENLDEAERRLATRGGASCLAGFRDLDERRRALLREGESLKAVKNSVSEEIGKVRDRAWFRTRSWRCAKCPTGSRCLMRNSSRSMTS